MDNQQIARAILAAVGPENITEAYNCMTRLRLRVSAVTVTKEQLKKIAGVKGVILNDGEIHVVLGPGKAENVAKECKRLLAEQGKTEASAQTAATDSDGSSANHTLYENTKPVSAVKQKPEARIGDGKELHAEIKRETAGLL